MRAICPAKGLPISETLVVVHLVRERDDVAAAETVVDIGSASDCGHLAGHQIIEIDDIGTAREQRGRGQGHIRAAGPIRRQYEGDAAEILCLIELQTVALAVLGNLQDVA